MFGASPPAGGGGAAHLDRRRAAPAPPPAAATDGGGEFARFVALCDRVASKGGSLDKTEAIKTHVVGLGAADQAYSSEAGDARKRTTRARTSSRTRA